MSHFFLYDYIWRIRHEWVTNESRIGHEWAPNELRLIPSWLRRHDWVKNESRTSHEWVTKQSRISRAWFITNESNESNESNRGGFMTHVSVAFAMLKRDNKWIHTTWIHTMNEYIQWIHTTTHQARLIYLHVTNESRMSQEWVTNELRFDSLCHLRWIKRNKGMICSHVSADDSFTMSHEWVTNESRMICDSLTLRRKWLIHNES